MNKRRLLTLVLALCGITSLCLGAPPDTKPLKFPAEVKIQLNSTNTEQKLYFWGTNTTAKIITIQGQMASCGCTKVEAGELTFQPGHTNLFRATISRTEPTVQSVMLKDDGGNFYTVILRVNK